MHSLLVLFLCLAYKAGGDPLSLELLPAHQQVALHQPISLRYVLTNRSQASLLAGDERTVPRPTLAAEKWGLMLSVTTPAG